jgi:hypothetical protein
MGLYSMNRFLPLITGLFLGTAATLVSSCARYVVSEPVLPALMVPPPSAGLAYESGSAAGLHYAPPIGVGYGSYGPPPEAYYGPAPEAYYGPPPEPPLGDEQYYGSYGPPPGDNDQFYAPPGPYSAPLHGPPSSVR